jgi:hypothetical protein
MRAGWGGIPSKHFGFMAIMQGFVICLIIPRLPYNKISAAGYLRSGGQKLHAPSLHFLKFKPLAAVMISGMKKFTEQGKPTRKSRSGPMPR